MPVFVWKERDKEYRLPFEGTPTVTSLLQKHGLAFPSPCGGNGRCGKCAVVLRGQVSPPDEREEQARCRLACRARLTGDAEGTPLAQDIPFFHIESTEYTPQKPIAESFAAVDVGTTTVAVKVFAQDGTPVGQAACLNPGRLYGADVMSRIQAAMEGHGEALQTSILECIRSLLASAGGQNVKNVTVTGNTAMLYLLTGRSPKSIAVAPFAAKWLFGETVELLGKTVYLPPCMHAFVGADLTCAVLASGMTDRDETALLCDIGTNGEIALWRNDRLYVTSVAAGPAFEGAEISCGCGFIPGAVDKVWTASGRIYAHTVENKPAVGLCGSGLLDAVAAFLETGDLDKDGLMEGNFLQIDSIKLTQMDIRQLQLAKAAIAASIELLLKQSDTKESELTKVYLAGGFGTHLSPVSAAAIGMIPRSFVSKAVPMGNAALQGACMLLEGEEHREKAQKIASSATHVEPGGNEEFNSAFVGHMNF